MSFDLKIQVTSLCHVIKTSSNSRTQICIFIPNAPNENDCIHRPLLVYPKAAETEGATGLGVINLEGKRVTLEYEYEAGVKPPTLSGDLIEGRSPSIESFFGGSAVCYQDGLLGPSPSLDVVATQFLIDRGELDEPIWQYFDFIYVEKQRIVKRQSFAPFLSILERGLVQLKVHIVALSAESAASAAPLHLSLSGDVLYLTLTGDCKFGETAPKFEEFVGTHLYDDDFKYHLQLLRDDFKAEIVERWPAATRSLENPGSENFDWSLVHLPAPVWVKPQDLPVVRAIFEGGRQMFGLSLDNLMQLLHRAYSATIVKENLTTFKTVRGSFLVDEGTGEIQMTNLIEYEGSPALLTYGDCMRVIGYSTDLSDLDGLLPPIAQRESTAPGDLLRETDVVEFGAEKSRTTAE